MMETTESIDLIVRNPKVRQGKPCIVGTGLRVMDIVMSSLFHDRNPGEIAAGYGVAIAQVHAALAYYYLNKDEIDEDIRQQIMTARELKEKGVGSREDSLLPN